MLERFIELRGSSKHDSLAFAAEQATTTWKRKLIAAKRQPFGWLGDCLDTHQVIGCQVGPAKELDCLS